MTLRRAKFTPAEPTHLPASVGRRRRRSFLLGLAALFALALTCASLALIATPAQAVQKHLFFKSFGSGHLNHPIGLAVDNSSTPSQGDIYIANQFSPATVQKYDSSGNLITSYGDTTPSPDGQLHGTALPGGAFSSPYNVAVDPSNGDLYVADSGAADTVDKFDSSGNLITSFGDSSPSPDGQLHGTAAGGFTPWALGVDPSTHNLYVGDIAGGKVDVFNSSGAFQASLSFAGVGYPINVALDSLGHVYVANAGAVLVYDASTGNLDSSYGGGSGILLSGTSNGLAVDPTTDHVYVGQYGGISEFDSSGNLLSTFGADASPALSGELFGLGVDAITHQVYVSDYNQSVADVFTPLVTLPNVTTNDASNIGHTTATMNGNVDPDAAHGGVGIDCHFEYGTDTTYSLGSLPCLNPANATVGTNANPITAPTDVHADLSGLSGLTGYYYRIVASNSIGTYGSGTSYGSNQIFFTSPPVLPTIDATSASNLTPVSATLNAQVNPGFGPTVVRFEYGTTTSYGSRTYSTDSIGDDNADHPASTDVSDLTPGATYHFRALATNFSGNTRGPDQTFTTPDLPALVENAATDVTQTTATLSASVRPGFRATTYHFEYGQTDSYGSSTPESASVGADNSVHPASATLTGLQPLTTYHYRIVATNSIGATTGPDQAFTTAASLPIVTPPPLTCKHGFVRRHGKCVKAHHKRRHHKRSH